MKGYKDPKDTGERDKIGSRGGSIVFTSFVWWGKDKFGIIFNSDPED